MSTDPSRTPTTTGKDALTGDSTNSDGAPYARLNSQLHRSTPSSSSSSLEPASPLHLCMNALTMAGMLDGWTTPDKYGATHCAQHVSQ